MPSIQVDDSSDAKPKTSLDGNAIDGKMGGILSSPKGPMACWPKPHKLR